MLLLVLFQLLRFRYVTLIFNHLLCQAWYRRGKLNTVLRNYKDAIRDITVSVSLESSPVGKKQLQNELKTMSDDQNKQTSEHSEYHRSNCAGVGEIFSHL